MLLSLRGRSGSGGGRTHFPLRCENEDSQRLPLVALPISHSLPQPQCSARAASSQRRSHCHLGVS